MSVHKQYVVECDTCRAWFPLEAKDHDAALKEADQVTWTDGGVAFVRGKGKTRSVHKCRPCYDKSGAI